MQKSFTVDYTSIINSGRAFTDDNFPPDITSIFDMDDF